MSQTKIILSLYVALLTASTYVNAAPTVNPIYQGCEEMTGFSVPLDFIAYLQEHRDTETDLRSVYENYAATTKDNFSNIDWMKTIPDLEGRLQNWRIESGRSSDGFTDECSQPTASSINSQNQINPVTAAAAINPTRPQHSLAKSIFRKKQIAVQIFDADAVPDGDVVNVYWNGSLIRQNLLLLKHPGISIPLTLQPSASLSTKVNQLKFYAVNGGTDFFGKASPAVNVALNNASMIVKGGPKIDVYPKQVEVKDLGLLSGVSVGKFSVPLDIALGLVCYDSYYPAEPQYTQIESTKHAVDAMAGKADDKGRKNSARIVTIDRLGATARRTKSTSIYPIISGHDRDEYPPALFLENGGAAHVRSILLADNRSFGRYLKNTVTGPAFTTVANALYPDGNQVELIVAPRTSGHGTLYCKDAW